MEFRGFRGFQEDRTDHRSYLQSFSRFGGTWYQKVHFSTFSGKLTFQCTRNGTQNPPFCPGSHQDTFIIYSSISHQHIARKYFAKRKISISINRQIRKSKNPGSLTGTQNNVIELCIFIGTAHVTFST